MVYTVLFREKSNPSFETSPIFGDVFEIPVTAGSYPEAVKAALDYFGMARDDVILCQTEKDPA